ncbi:hypothetical protein WICPIJ_008161, partial [Wickerhamomyces pijperi]
MQDTQQICQICFTEPSKYKCPACTTQTCSLPCIKLHKAQSQCSGIQDTTKYIPRTDFEKDGEGERMLQRDYNFLSGLGRELQVRKDDVKSKNKRILQSGSNSYGNKRQNRNAPPANYNSEDGTFKQTTLIKRGVNVKILPKGMSRAFQNKSYFDKRSSEFMWTLEMIMVDAENGEVLNSGINWKCSECTKVRDTINDKLRVTFGLPERQKKEATEADTQTQTQTQTQISQPNCQPSEELHYFLKMIDTPQNKPVLKYLDPTKPLGEVLKGESVIEFPTLIVSTQREIKGAWSELVEPVEEESSSDSGDDSSGSSEES